jgi:hypothetical protein
MTACFSSDVPKLGLGESPARYFNRLLTKIELAPALLPSNVVEDVFFWDCSLSHLWDLSTARALFSLI